MLYEKSLLQRPKPNLLGHHMPEEPLAKRQKLESTLLTGSLSVTSLPGPSFHASTTYHSQIPRLILENKTASVVLGVDEAGRGQCWGQWFMAFLIALKVTRKISNTNMDLPTPMYLRKTRDELFYMVELMDHELNENVGWATRTMTARTFRVLCFKAVELLEPISMSKLITRQYSLYVKFWIWGLT